MVVAAGVEDQFAEEFAGGGVDDPDLKVVDDDQDVRSGVGSPDADVVEPAVDSESDDAGAVGADAVVDLAGSVAAGGVLGAGCVGGGEARSSVMDDA